MTTHVRIYTPATRKKNPTKATINRFKSKMNRKGRLMLFANERQITPIKLRLERLIFLYLSIHLCFFSISVDVHCHVFRLREKPSGMTSIHRLPTHVIPHHYRLFIDASELEQFRFRGTVQIDVEVSVDEMSSFVTDSNHR